MKLTLPRKKRLSNKEEYAKLKEKPFYFKSKHLEIFYINSEISKVGITIKGYLTSVWRTRLKRLLREFFRVHLQSIKEKRSYNFVLKMPKTVDFTYFDELKQSLKSFEKHVNK